MKNGTSGFEFDHWMQSSPDTLLVYMRGQMVYETLDATDGCWQAVRHAFRRSVLLDFSQVTYLASAALGSLCGLRRWLVRFEGQGTLHTLNAAVAIGVIAVGKIFTIEPRSQSKDEEPNEHFPHRFRRDSGPLCHFRASRHDHL